MDRPAQRQGSLFGELKRRNVLRMAVLYVVTAWLIMQVAEVVGRRHGVNKKAPRLGRAHPHHQ